MKKIKKEDFMGNDIDKVTGSEDAENQDAAEAGAEKEDAEAGAAKEKNLEEELQEQKDKHLRLYAEFENYKKRAARDKEELVKYGNESLLYELLPVLDNLDMALKHSSCLSAKQDPSNNAPGEGLVQGVEITLKEFLRVLERAGLTPIDALNKVFDPAFHHAMAQVERDDVDENTVVEEYRKGYILRDKVLRPSLVAVSKKSAGSEQRVAGSEEKENTEEKIEEEE